MFNKQAEGDYSGTKYEYKVVSFMKIETEASVAATMNKLGEQGWELMVGLDRPMGGMKLKGDNAFTLMFKREVR